MKKSNKPAASPGNHDAAKPIKKKEEVGKNPDPHIDQDFPGYPHTPSEERVIKPETQEDKTAARLIKKEKYTPPRIDPQNSNGSAEAFSRTEDDRLRGELEDDREEDRDNY